MSSDALPDPPVAPQTDSPPTNVSSDSPDNSAKEQQPQVNLLDVPVTDENSALNVIVGFLGIAQRRGAFAINESAKIFECVKMFQPGQSA